MRLQIIEIRFIFLPNGRPRHLQHTNYKQAFHTDKKGLMRNTRDEKIGAPSPCAEGINNSVWLPRAHSKINPNLYRKRAIRGCYKESSMDSSFALRTYSVSEPKRGNKGGRKRAMTTLQRKPLPIHLAESHSNHLAVGNQ